MTTEGAELERQKVTLHIGLGDAIEAYQGEHLQAHASPFMFHVSAENPKAS